ncbi:NosD domain-containing protein [Roseibacillus persicicus]|uniref:NosD domain-containing protein n=1 Tax=Roseibacillus persicicus TaxID=454148 RepID=UPI00398AEF04
MRFLKFLLFLFPLSTSVSSAETLTVGSAETYPSISSAVAAADSGDVILLTAGIYEESVTLEKAITIQGPNVAVSAETGIALRNPEAIVRGGILIPASAAGSQIEGIAFENGADYSDQFVAIQVEAEDVSLRNLVFGRVGTQPAAGPDSCAARFADGANRALVDGCFFGQNLNGVVLRSADSVILTENLFSAQTATGLVLSASATGATISRNRFVGNQIAVRNLGLDEVELSSNYWASDWQFPPVVGGNRIEGPAIRSPWYSDWELESLVHGVSADEIIGEGERVSVSNLVVSESVTYSVEGGELELAHLVMEPNSVLRVVGGQLTLGLPDGGSHVIAGTFEVTHSLGSIEILDDTDFSGSTLALVSDFHIADGVNLSVTGSLDLDGCSLLGEGDFNLSVNIGATLRMRRCRVENGNLFIVANDVLVADNHFRGSGVTVLGPVDGARIFHNVFHDGVDDLNVFPGTVVVTESESWGNVESDAETRNRLVLNWLETGLDGRTLDADGNLYVQPGDPVCIAIESGGFTERIQAMEALLAYHTGYLSQPEFRPTSPWDNELYFDDQPLSVFGKVDTAVGFGFNHESPQGSLTDNRIGEIDLVAAMSEGRTVAFFREKDPANDMPLIDTRLTAWVADDAEYLNEPFTQNSSVLTIDGTVPQMTLEPWPVTQDLGEGPVDVSIDGVYTRAGTLDVSFAAFDELSGLNLDTASVRLEGDSILPMILVETTEVTFSGELYTHFSFELPIDASTEDGLYNVVARVSDRSGNEASLLLGTIEVARQILAVEVQGQEWIAGGLNRAVEFVFTDSSEVVLERRTIPMEFSNQIGMASLVAVPLGTAHVSAKTAWTLRHRLSCSFDSGGDGTVSFTGTNQLRGGDLNGDNVISLQDFTLLRDSYFTTDSGADIDGSGGVNIVDYNILRSNYFTAGSSE